MFLSLDVFCDLNMNILCSKIIILLYCYKALADLKSTTTTISLIKDYGYPYEEHNVTTQDGYILALFRIPYSPKDLSDSENRSRKPVAFLVHGFAQSSADWVLSGSPRALALLLADKGYDVWLGNPRGTRYSRKNVKYSPDNPLFWRFSWHEIGVYDLPSSIQYIMNLTSSSQIQYIAHSQGTTAFLVAASTVAGFNEHIKSAHLLAPVAFFSHATSKIVKGLAIFLGHPNPLAAIGDFKILSNGRLNQILSDIFCVASSLLQNLCLDLTYIVYGEGSTLTNKSVLSIFFETVPQGVSVKQLFHFLQLYNSKKFRQFDYGFLTNYIHYEQLTPPDYKLQQITAPIFLYHSDNDALASPKDVETLTKALPQNVLRKVYKMPFKDWNHVDFILANNVDKLLYNIVINNMQVA